MRTEKFEISVVECGEEEERFGISIENEILGISAFLVWHDCL